MPPCPLHCTASHIPSGCLCFCFALSLSAAASVIWEMRQSEIKNELYRLILIEQWELL